MNIWIVTESDGFTYSHCFIAAFSTLEGAEAFCKKMNERYPSTYGGYEVLEETLDEPDEPFCS